MFLPCERISATTTSIPFLSIVRNAAFDRRRLIHRFSFSSQNLRLCKFGKKRRLFLLLAWDTLFPVNGFLPVTSHTRAMLMHPEITKTLIISRFWVFSQIYIWTFDSPKIVKKFKSKLNFAQQMILFRFCRQ